MINQILINQKKSNRDSVVLGDLNFTKICSKENRGQVGIIITRVAVDDKKKKLKRRTSKRVKHRKSCNIESTGQRQQSQSRRRRKSRSRSRPRRNDNDDKNSVDNDSRVMMKELATSNDESKKKSRSRSGRHRSCTRVRTRCGESSRRHRNRSERRHRHCQREKTNSARKKSANWTNQQQQELEETALFFCQCIADEGLFRRNAYNPDEKEVMAYEFINQLVLKGLCDTRQEGVTLAKNLVRRLKLLYCSGDNDNIAISTDRKNILSDNFVVYTLNNRVFNSILKLSSTSRNEDHDTTNKSTKKPHKSKKIKKKKSSEEKEHQVVRALKRELRLNYPEEQVKKSETLKKQLSMKMRSMYTGHHIITITTAASNNNSGNQLSSRSEMKSNTVCGDDEDEESKGTASTASNSRTASTTENEEDDVFEYKELVRLNDSGDNESYTDITIVEDEFIIEDENDDDEASYMEYTIVGDDDDDDDEPVQKRASGIEISYLEDFDDDITAITMIPFS